MPVDSPIAPEDVMPAPRLVAIAYALIWLVLLRLPVVGPDPAVDGGAGDGHHRSAAVAGGSKAAMNFGNMTAAHFVFIPAVLLIGMVIGWILGSRAAADAYARGAEETRGTGEPQTERAHG